MSAECGDVEMEKERVYPRRSGHNGCLCLSDTMVLSSELSLVVICSVMPFLHFSQEMFLLFSCKHDSYNIRSYLFPNMRQKKTE